MCIFRACCFFPSKHSSADRRVHCGNVTSDLFGQLSGWDFTLIFHHYKYYKHSHCITVSSINRLKTNINYAEWPFSKIINYFNSLVKKKNKFLRINISLKKKNNTVFDKRQLIYHHSTCLQRPVCCTRVISCQWNLYTRERTWQSSRTFLPFWVHYALFRGNV